MDDFSRRYGYLPVRAEVQIEALDHETRIALWNLCHTIKGMAWEREHYEDCWVPLERIWTRNFSFARDDVDDEQVWDEIKERVQNAEFHLVFTVVEALVREMRDDHLFGAEEVTEFAKQFNEEFQRHLVGWRFVGDFLVPLDSRVEVDAVDSALSAQGLNAGARTHLERSVKLLSSRDKPDYVNSIKESISAVEAVVAEITGDGTLSKALGKLEARGLKLHPALRGGWAQLYGWTGDDGIRHSQHKDHQAKVDQALAKYFLVSASAFVTYLTDEWQQTSTGDDDSADESVDLDAPPF